MNEQIVVSEKMARFIEWANSLGEDECRRLVRENINELKKLPPHMRDKNGFYWDIRLEENDGNDQYRTGGDCTLCKRANYCSKQCGANKALKKVSTPFLYQRYLEAHPEEVAKEVAATMTPDDVLKAVGVQDDGNPKVDA